MLCPHLPTAKFTSLFDPVFDLRERDCNAVSGSETRREVERRRSFRKKQEHFGKLKLLVHKVAAASIVSPPSPYPALLQLRIHSFAAMSYRTIYEIAPLVSSRLRSSGSSGALSRPCRNFGAVARATTLTNNPWFSDFDDFWLRPAPRQLSDTLFDLASPFPISSHASRLMVRVVLTHRHHLCCFASFKT